MLDGILIAKAPTLELDKTNPETENESAQGNENTGALLNVRLAAEELSNNELLIETTRPETLLVPQDD